MYTCMQAYVCRPTRMYMAIYIAPMYIKEPYEIAKRTSTCSCLTDLTDATKA